MAVAHVRRSFNEGGLARHVGRLLSRYARWRGASLSPKMIYQIKSVFAYANRFGFGRTVFTNHPWTALIFLLSCLPAAARRSQCPL
jgi:hypothetical protein